MVLISSVFDPTTTAVSDVGGKAASLFRLQESGFSVPPFFVVVASACHGGELVETAEQEILRGWESLGGDQFEYAVRSSAVSEDSPDHSFAGVFDTVLNVRGREALFAAISRCIQSHGSFLAEAYRSGRSIDDDSGMAVVVQRMVPATWAGVCFTADPTAQALSVLVINASPGLGEALVSGLVNPDEIKVDARSGAVLDRTTPRGQIAFPSHLLKLLVQRAQEIAEAFDFPQDIEWAVADEELLFLQSRPITTIAGVWFDRPLEPWLNNPIAEPDRADRVWSRAYADEVWAPPVSPLFYDVQNLTGEFPMQLGRYGDNAPCPPDTFKYYRAAPYLDVAILERLYAFRPRMCRLPSLLNQLPPERREPMRSMPWRWSGLVRRTWEFEITHGPRWGFTRNHQFLKRAWPGFLDAAISLGNVDEAALDDAALDRHLQDIWEVAATIGVECGITVFYYAQDLKLLLTALLDHWLGNGEALYATVSAGLTDSHTLKETEGIHHLAGLIRGQGSESIKEAQQHTWAEFCENPSHLTIANEFSDFLKKNGHRGANYKDLIYPRWGDDPELLWSQVQAFLAADGPTPTEIHARSATARVAAQRECLDNLRGFVAPVYRTVLRSLFKYNEIYMSLRDNHRFYYDWIWWLLRRVYLEKGRRLYLRELIGDPDEVFYLVRTEIESLSAGHLPREAAAARISSRRRDWLATRHVQPPKFLHSGYVPHHEAAEMGEEGRLIGLAASAGRVVGRARIVHDVRELGRVGASDILITRQTDPSWTPAFARLSGLVLETGGVLAHGASLCREFNVPCVTAVENATRRIPEGAMIAVDGGIGVDEIVEWPTDAVEDAAVAQG